MKICNKNFAKRNTTLLVIGFVLFVVSATAIFLFYQKDIDQVHTCWGQEYVYPPITNFKVEENKMLVQSKRPLLEIRQNGAVLWGCVEEGTSVLINGSAAIFAKNNRQFIIKAKKGKSVLLRLEKNGRKREFNIDLD
jgi:hypothetical protein